MTTTSPTMRRARPVVNPHLKRPPLVPHNQQNMGRQSQQRVSNTKRAYQLASNSNNNKKKKGDQLTLDGQVAFNAERDCKICGAKETAKFVEGYTIPHRGHHILCSKNKVTQGFGPISQANIQTAAEQKRLKELYFTPLKSNEKASSKFCTKEATTAFFSPRIKKMEPKTTTTSATTTTTSPPIDFGKAVVEMLSNDSFCEKHKSKSAPIAMIAFASVVVDKLIHPKDSSLFQEHFDVLTMTVPTSAAGINNPHYHSITGQKLLLVEWNQACGVNLPCPDKTCDGILKNERTQFSKNKTLFPIFGFDGPPKWCMIMKMSCSCCQRQFDSNSAEILLSLPAYMSNRYPVEPRYALPNHSFHLSNDATNILDNLMLTYANGEMFSQLLYKSVNKAYLNKITEYFSYQMHNPRDGKVEAYVEKDGTCIKQYPPWRHGARHVQRGGRKSLQPIESEWQWAPHTWDTVGQVWRRNICTRSYVFSHSELSKVVGR